MMMPEQQAAAGSADAGSEREAEGLVGECASCEDADARLGASYAAAAVCVEAVEGGCGGSGGESTCAMEGLV